MNQYRIYLRDNFENVFTQISEYKKFNKQIVFLEIGCGPMYLAKALADKCKLVAGVDFSYEALKMAEKMFSACGIKNYLLILSDINKMPIKDNTFDIVYGGGVIEHFKNTQQALCEIHRVLSPGGISFNAVPHLNLGSLTYRQMWGNIPDFPVLKQLAEFVHIKVLKARHMKFGYELSFLASRLKYMHKKAGFKKVYVGKFETKLMFEFIPNKRVKKFLDRLANSSSLFWPMIKVIGVK